MEHIIYPSIDHDNVVCTLEKHIGDVGVLKELLPTFP